MNTGLARYHRAGLPRPDRFPDHLLHRLLAGARTPDGCGGAALLEALRQPTTAAELERRPVVVPRLAAVIRASAQQHQGAVRA